MGRKVNPRIFRIPLVRDWESKWFAKGYTFRQFLKEDLQIRKFLEQRLKNCWVSSIGIERVANTIRVIIHSAKPGLIIGRGGLDIEGIKKTIKDEFLGPGITLEINVIEESSPMLSAAIVLEGAIGDLEKRLPYRRVLKKVVRQVMSAGAQGVKIMVSGRLGGVEIARSEKLIQGKLPLHTMRADIDYARATAATLYGSIGVKVWIYKGEKFEQDKTKKKE
ncbi:30S ribosomal protein S3 [Patescibacteria group bacterium AH-259-L05]|nr:30S ribosomal protein S3 [Patescibacteria group bacterium AH-259-L05]